MRFTRKRRGGFTLPELIVSMSVLGLVLAGSTATLLKIQQQYTSQRGTVEARETIRSLELLFSRLFRTQGANPLNMTPSSVRMTVSPVDPYATEWSSVELRADFNPADGALIGDFENASIKKSNDTVYVRFVDGGDFEAVAYPVSELRFQFYEANGTTEITNPGTAAVSGRRVKITIGAPIKKTSKTLRRELWVSLRN
jgi:prepilin-type N-terminal cleavage/methylation domain-containing protein